jgi:putative tryptophan/tyrosine transport system substrate-binding protein
MNKRAFLAGLIAAAALPTARGQPAFRKHRVGVLLITSSPGRTDTLVRELRRYGYVEGQNIEVIDRAAEGRADQLPQLARELVHLNVDVLVTETNAGGRAAKEATRSIPIVMGVAGDPLTAGLVANLARPGGNITGLSLQAPELSAKRVQLLKQALPDAGVVSVIYNATNPSANSYLRETQSAAASLSIRLHAVQVRGPADLDGAFEAVSQARPRAFMTLADGMLLQSRARITQFGVKTALPGVFPEREFAEAGGLMSYGPNVDDVWRRSAGYVDKILKGAKPGDLPIEAPVKFELVVNLRTAKNLALTLPPAVLARADEMIR